MQAHEIPAYEQDFRQRGIDSNGRAHTLRPLTVPIAGQNERLNVVVCQPASGDASYYYQEEPLKDRVVLHFTGGYLKGDIALLTRPNYHVSVPFVIARDGTIYNLFNSKYWSYHIGPGAIGGNETMSRRSVGVEISSIGPLVRKGDQLFSIYGKLYCSANQPQYFVREPFRGHEYYATFTDTQYRSLILLLRYITGKFSIPRQFLPPAQRFTATAEVADFHGIVTHANFRVDKLDFGPACDWQRITGAVRAH